MTQAKILIVEDEAALREAMQRGLMVNSHWTLEVAATAEEAWDKWLTWSPDLVLLDLTLGTSDGITLLKSARNKGLSTAVLILTARGTVGDRVAGLQAGADDYLPKPFDLLEVEARINALLRRSISTKSLSDESEKWMQVGNLQWRRSPSEFKIGEEHLQLTPRESTLLHLLLRRLGSAVSKEALLAAIYENEPEVGPDAIEVLAYRLRKRLHQTDIEIITLRGLGYMARAINNNASS